MRSALEQESSMCSVYHNGRSLETLQSASFMGVPNPIKGVGAGTHPGQIGVSPGAEVIQPSGQLRLNSKRYAPKLVGRKAARIVGSICG